MLRVLDSLHALLRLFEEAWPRRRLFAAAEAVELVEKPVFAVIVEALLVLAALFFFLLLFLSILSLFPLLSVLLGPLRLMFVVLLLFFFLVDLNLTLQLPLSNGLAEMLEGLVGTLEGILSVLARNSLFLLKRHILIIRLLMLVNNVIYVLLWRLGLRFLLGYAWLCSDLSVILLTILTLFLELFLYKVIHFLFFLLLRITQGLLLGQLLLLLMLLFGPLLLFRFLARLFLLRILHLLQGLGGLLLHLGHMLRDCHIVRVLLALSGARLLLDLAQTLLLLLLGRLFLLLVLLLKNFFHSWLLWWGSVRKRVGHHLVQFLAVQSVSLHRCRVGSV